MHRADQQAKVFWPQPRPGEVIQTWTVMTAGHGGSKRTFLIEAVSSAVPKVQDAGEAVDSTQAKGRSMVLVQIGQWQGRSGRCGQMNDGGGGFGGAQ